MDRYTQLEIVERVAGTGESLDVSRLADIISFRLSYGEPSVTFAVAERQRRPGVTLDKIFKSSPSLNVLDQVVSRCFDVDFPAPVMEYSLVGPLVEEPVFPPDIIQEGGVSTRRVDRLERYLRYFDYLCDLATYLPEYATHQGLDRICEMLEDRMHLLGRGFRRGRRNPYLAQLYVEYALLRTTLDFNDYERAIGEKKIAIAPINRYSQIEIFLRKVLPQIDGITSSSGLSREKFLELLEANAMVWDENIREAITTIVYSRRKSS